MKLRLSGIKTQLILYVLTFIVASLLAWYVVATHWHISPRFKKAEESLQAPVAIRTVTDKTLILEDGREIKLPNIKKLPKDNPLFESALVNGVEIQDDGEVIVLLKVYKSGGYREKLASMLRINLSDLVGTINRDFIEDSIDTSPDPYGTIWDERPVTDERLIRAHLSRLRETRRIFDNSNTKKDMSNNREQPDSQNIGSKK